MKTFLTAFFTLLFIASFAQNGTVKESLKLKSATLDKDVEYSIYLPSDYETSDRKYPVLYLLHGFTDDETGWVQFGEAPYIADRAINSGQAPPMIIVMPDAGVSWYVNSYDGKSMWEDFFIKEFIPHIDATYRTRTAREFRAVAGLSMGGHGSLIMATRHPDLFTACAPLSAGVWVEEEAVKMPKENWDYVVGEPYGKGLEGQARLTEHYRKNSVLDVIKNGNADELKKVKFYIDCGDDDFLIKGNMALHAAMIDKGIPHEFRVRDGGHSWIYWRTALPEVLKFVGESFHR
ncbi:MAG: esterase family protein [Bacteroidetes bacterium]|nr:esterase family protein [Bacteroidota bacterium]